MKRVRLYEQDGILSAIWVTPSDDYLELRVDGLVAVTWKSVSTCYSPVVDRISCERGEQLAQTEFPTPEQAKMFFWTTVGDPESLWMECQL